MLTDKQYFPAASKLLVASSLLLFQEQCNASPWRQSYIQCCKNMHTCTHRAQCTEASCLLLCHYCKRIPPASALTHSINLSPFDRNYAHLFSHSPHTHTLRDWRQTCDFGLQVWLDGGQFTVFGLNASTNGHNMMNDKNISCKVSGSSDTYMLGSVVFF